MIKLYNTLGHKLEEFKPLKPGSVSMYVCGPTVYGPDHLGHIKTWIFFDFLKRFFVAEGYKVKLIQNITDVGSLVGDGEVGEDKIEKAAKAENKTPEEIARFYEDEHVKDLASLNFLPIDSLPRATDHIEDIIDYIENLINKGYAYEKNSNVYFDVSKDSSYGVLSGRKLEDMLTGTRVKEDENKKHPADFILWSKTGEKTIQKWPSPWGDGYPGWHIECSVMSEKYLGKTFDIHGSGIEHVFPHHENELAQSRCQNTAPLAIFWLHTGMLDVNGEKMSKSKGNFITVKEAIKTYSPDTIRLFFLTGLWRKPLDWNEASLEEARKMVAKITRAKNEAKLEKSGYRLEIANALEDDFNTPKALGVIFSHLQELGKEDFKYIEEVFGLKLEDEVKLTQEQKDMVEKRETARKNGDYALADKIRKELEQDGVILEDTSEGTKTYKSG